jgi:hypothetical protein
MGDRETRLPLIIRQQCRTYICKPLRLKHFHRVHTGNAHGCSLTLSIGRVSSYNLQLVFVNSGNRQGVISELDVGYSINKFGVQGYMPFRPPQPTVEGVPVLLNPGDMRLVTIKGTLAINNMYENGSPVNQSMGSATSAKVDEREVSIVLQFRSLDFRGNRYTGKWDVGRMTLAFPILGLSKHSCTFPANAWLCTKSVP